MITDVSRCTRPPDGWYCTRSAGHEGPCAAWPIEDVLLHRRQRVNTLDLVFVFVAGVACGAFAVWLTLWPRAG